MEQRRLGRLEQMDSVLIYGGFALSEVDQDVADESIAAALEAGVNHLDTAAAYGNSELRLAPWMPEIRESIFLSTKTGERTREGARAQIERSLERLAVERVDLIQLHSVGEGRELDAITAPGGALEAAVAAREEGLVGAIGITGHGVEAPGVHLEALRRFPFDTVLTPWSVALGRDPDYREQYDALVAEVRRQDAGLMAMKAVARRNWPEGAEQRYGTWYEPLDRQEEVDAALAFVLAHPAVTGVAMVGDVRLQPLMLDAERRRQDLPPDEAERVLGGAEEYSSPFLALPYGP